MTNKQIILLIFAIFALTSALLGYSGLVQRIIADPYADLKTEGYRIVDYSQLWFSRSANRNGGDRSFTGLDFHKINFSPYPDARSIETDNGRFLLRNITDNSFDLEAHAKDGTILLAGNLQYNSRPEFVKK